MNVLRVSLLLLAAAGFGGAATLQNCSTCQGGVYTLNFSNFTAGGVTDSFRLTLTIDTTDYVGGGLYINAVAPKPGTALVSVTPVSAPSTSPGGSSWSTALNQGINAGGCSGGGTGFFCTKSSGLGAAVANLSNTWVWDVTVMHGTMFEDLVGASLKVRYVDAEGAKVGDLVSEDFGGTVPPGEVPEPTTLLTVGSGLLAASLFTRRIRARK